jgi:hypothetical protein
VKNVEITEYSTEITASSSFNVEDKSVWADHITMPGQQIRLTLEPKRYKSNPAPFNTLQFDAERTGWNNFTVKNPSAHHIFYFNRSEYSSYCGILSITPDEETTREVCNNGSPAHRNWSLVQLYHLRLRRWDHVNDEIQDLLEVIARFEGAEEDSKKFRNRMQRSNLIYVLLIRRRGLYWERVGSGLMFQRFWPSASKRAKVRSYHERIVLV